MFSTTCQRWKSFDLTMVTNPFSNNKLSVSFGPTKQRYKQKKLNILHKKITGHRYITHCLSWTTLNRRRKTHKMYRGSDGRITVANIYLYHKLYIFPCFFEIHGLTAAVWIIEVLYSSCACLCKKSKYSSQVIESFPSCTVCTVSTQFAAVSALVLRYPNYCSSLWGTFVVFRNLGSTRGRLFGPPVNAAWSQA